MAYAPDQAILVPLTPRSRIGAFEIRGSLGSGGMGEVYRGRDCKLDRDVALKILPEAFARDVDRVGRFKREAQVLASLNHPNIATIYGFEDSGSVRALVLELVEGPTLAELIAASGPSAPGRNPDAAFVERSGQRPRPSAQSQQARRGLSIDEALPIARQIADVRWTRHAWSMRIRQRCSSRLTGYCSAVRKDSTPNA